MHKNKNLWLFLDVFLLVVTFYLLFNFLNISVGDGAYNFKISTPKPSLMPTVREMQKASLSSYDSIIKSSIFGDYLPKSTPSPLPTPSPTPLIQKDDKEEPGFSDYVLKGTIVGKDTISYVIMEDDMGKEKLYKLDDVVNGFKIVRIEKNVVVLKNKEKIIKLKLKEEEP